MIIESHAHYDDEAFDQDREELLGSFEDNGIGCVINVSSDLASVESTLELSARYPFVYAAVGVHPSDTGELNEETFDWLRRKCREDKCVAVGEIGLDYHWDKPDRETQKKWFARQLELSQELDLPVIIHSRDAARDTLDVIGSVSRGKMRGVVHCFSYSREVAREFMEMGFCFGIGGVVTFPNAKKLKEAVAFLPLDRLLLETDSPYLAPAPNRGKRNSSLNLPLVAGEIARLKGVEDSAVIRATQENAVRLFRLPETAGSPAENKEERDGAGEGKPARE